MTAPRKKSAARKPSTVEAAAKSGDERSTLEAMRDALAAALDAADPAVKAQLSGQLVKVLERLASLPSKQESTVDKLRDDLAARRAKARQGQVGGAAQRKPRSASS